MSNLLAELRRRSVFRVAGVYVVAAWLVMQIVAASMSALELPSWFDGAVWLLLAVGFVIVVVAAWAFELSPEGLRRTTPAAGGAEGRPGTVADMVVAAALVAVLGVSLYQAARPRAASPDVRASAARSADARPSIAVLPFADMSPAHDQDYFSDGLSEEILNQLAQLQGLRVIARTSSFAFKDENPDLRAVGDALGVANVLEGSVRTDGERLRITAQLINAADGSHIWSQTYDRDLDDVFAIQEEIAAAVADALRVALDVSAPRRRVGGTDDVEAYDAYLRGRALGNDTAGVYRRQAVEQLQRAVELDPDFVEAWAELSQAYSLVELYAESADVQERAIEGMERAAQRAVDIAPDHWASQVALARLRAGQRRWLESARAMERARELAERAGVDMSAESWGYELQPGWFETSLAELRETLELDPLAPIAATAIADIDYILGRRAEPPDADDIGTLFTRLDLAVARGDGELADALIAQGVGGDDPLAARLAEVWRAPDEAPAALRELAAAPRFSSRLDYLVMAVLADHFGEPDLAVDLMRRACLDSDNFYFTWIVWVPALKEARATDGFKDLVRELGLVELWRETGEWSDLCRPLSDDDFECF